jgi:hypothetical protein
MVYDLILFFLSRIFVGTFPTLTPTRNSSTDTCYLGSTTERTSIHPSIHTAYTTTTTERTTNILKALFSHMHASRT